MRATPVSPVDRHRRSAGPRHRLRRQVLRPRRPPLLHHRRARGPAACVVPVPAVRGGGADHQPRQRRGGAARHREVAPLPGRRRDRAAGRRHRPAAGARRWLLLRDRERGPLRPRQAHRRVFHLLHGETGEAEGLRGARGVVRPRAVAQPGVPAIRRGEESCSAAGDAVHELGRIRHHDRRRRGEGAGAAQPFCLRPHAHLARPWRGLVPGSPAGNEQLIGINPMREWAAAWVRSGASPAGGEVVLFSPARLFSFSR